MVCRVDLEADNPYLSRFQDPTLQEIRAPALADSEPIEVQVGWLESGWPEQKVSVPVPTGLSAMNSTHMMDYC
jgi:hypothetical protein